MGSDLQAAVQHAAATVGPATVGIGSRWGRGSGLVVADGRVLTNAHNAPGGRVGVVFGDGREVTGEVTAADVAAELAVLAVDTGDVESPPWADPDHSADLGAPVIALANPGGRGLHATAGRVSATDRSFRGPRGHRIAGAVEHTAALVRGSSGGPLLDRDGRLIGVNTHRLEGGLYLALPADEQLRGTVDRLRRGEQPTRPRLGIAVAPASTARRLREAVGLEPRDGLLVREVAADGPAAAAGVRRGDLIVAAGGTDVADVDQLHELLAETGRDGDLALTLVRGTEELRVTATPAGAGQPGAGP